MVLCGLLGVGSELNRLRAGDGATMNEDRSEQWRKRLAAVAPHMEHGGAFLAVFLDADGQTAYYGADFSRNPKFRANLIDHCRRFSREIKKLDRNETNITGLRGASREL